MGGMLTVYAAGVASVQEVGLPKVEAVGAGAGHLAPTSRHLQALKPLLSFFRR